MKKPDGGLQITMAEKTNFQISTFVGASFAKEPLDVHFRQREEK